MNLGRGKVILSEHEEHIWQMERKKEANKTLKLDPNALKEIGHLIQRSKVEEQAILVTYLSKYGPKKYIGHVIQIDPVERWLVMQNGEDKIMIPFSLIMKVE
jgi:hydrogenase maturation factor